MNRHLKFLFILAAVLLMSGCGKDDDPEADNELVGTWQLKTSNAEITVPGGVTLRQYLIAELAMSPEQADTYVTFFQSSEAPTMDISSIEFKNDGKYLAHGKGDANFDGTWELTVGDQAVVFDKDTDHHMPVTVITLDATTLTLAFDMSDDVGLPHITYISVLSFDRK